MKYYIWVLGCAMNYSDAERISAVFDSLGFSKTDDEREADIFLVVACSVRQSAINRIYGKARDLNAIKKKKKLITILSGCVLDEDRKKMANIFDIMFEIKDLNLIPELLMSTLSKSELEKIGKSGEYLSISPHYESTFRAYVPIMTGCNNFCTYCAVPYTRGREKSRPVNEIVSEVKSLVKKGYKEITLLGQNVNSYGNDLDNNLNKSFAELLLEIDKIKGDHRIYFYSNHPKDFSTELIATLPKLIHFPHYIHLPLQSGNNEIIRKMNRHYTKESYLELVKKIKKAIPGVTITTDIIVGFPTETEDQFEETAEVMKKVDYDMAFIAQYSPRSGTVSAKITDDVTKDEKKIREDILQKILAESVLKINKKIIGNIEKVLIDGEKDGKFYGRTESYKVVEIKTDQALLLGQYINVKVISCTAWKLFGELI